MKRVAILQSNYIPWKDYFDLVRAADEFMLYECAQYTRQDWRNRNLIKTPSGKQWLTIPIKSRFSQRIIETEVGGAVWAGNHWKTLEGFYHRAPYFDRYRSRFEAVYRSFETETRLSRINHRLIFEAADILGIKTRITVISDMPPFEDSSARLVHLCRQAGAQEYLTGPSARNYLDVGAFERAGIQVLWADYQGYPEYPQLHPPFMHEVTVLDLIFNVGVAGRRRPKAIRCCAGVGAGGAPCGQCGLAGAANFAGRSQSAGLLVHRRLVLCVRSFHQRFNWHALYSGGA